MGELTIRRNRLVSTPQYQSISKGEKTSGSSASQRPAAAKPGFTISETLQQLMSRISQGEGQLRESRRTLGTGESVLDEVQERLGRMTQLAQQAAEDSSSGRAALQAELKLLLDDVSRMIGAASAGGAPLFLDEGAEGTDALLFALLRETPTPEEGLALPEWLLSDLTRVSLSSDQLLAALGLDRTASPEEILAAVIGRPLDEDPAAGYLAALYLGAVIAGGGEPDPQAALDGLRQLLDITAQGVPLDQAIQDLTNGAFASLDDFQTQFTAGIAPGLQDFLGGLLLPDAGSDLLAGLSASSLLALLAGAEGANLDLLMGLLTVLPSSEVSSEAAAQSSAGYAAASQGAEVGQTEAPVSVLSADGLQVLGRDLSQVSVSGHVLTVGGTADVLIQGTGQGGQEIHITGSGTVTLQNVDLSRLTVSSPQASLFTVGENATGQLLLAEGTDLTLDGRGVLRAAVLSGGQTSLLRQTGGAVIVGQPGEASKPLTLPLVLDGPAVLSAQAAQVTSSSGRALTPFDLVWDALLPGWSSIHAIAAQDAEASMTLLNGETPDPVRLWLLKGDQGYPVHTLLLRGRNKAGQLLTRYAYLCWSQHAGAFQEVSMYPNPFTVTGGEAGRDWVYEEETHTLHILSNQVSALSGGSGTDGNQTPFSGRIALADGIGSTELALGGVVCQVSAGRAFDLGRDNRVTLILQGGTENRFESGAGCAGISLGDGTSLSVDRESGAAAGTLSATGKEGGAGIGRDSGAGRDRNSRILIRGGVITASGSGGGAGIGAGRYGAMGTVTILGGAVVSTGGTGGGAGIGGALGAPVGDISIRGGSVTAEAVYHAAAIGAGIQGACGDILITGTARIVKALGGDPGADIGACLFGGCGEVQVSGAADIGGAKLRCQSGIPLQTGEDTLTLPQFRLSPSALGLDRLSVSTREEAQAAQVTLEAGRQLISQIQAAYGALHTRLEQGLQGRYRYGGTFQGPLRSAIAAAALLQDMRTPLQSGQALLSHSKRGTGEVGQLLQ